MNNKSVDSADCGHVDKPCKTIEHAILLTSSYDRICIDAADENNKTYTYPIQNAMVVENELTITDSHVSSSSLNLKPTIAFSTTAYNLLLVYTTKSLNFTNVNIAIKCDTIVLDYIYITLFKLDGSSGVVQITNSDVYVTAENKSPNLGSVRSTISKIIEGNWRIRMMDSKVSFNVPTFLGKSDQLTTKNMLKENSRSHLVSSSANISIENCAFSSMLYGDAVIFPVLGEEDDEHSLLTQMSLYTTASNFTNVAVEMNSHVSVIQNCLFNVSAVLFIADTVEISNSIFIKNQEILHLVNVITGHLSKCNFVDCPGMLNLQNSTVAIVDTVFTTAGKIC